MPMSRPSPQQVRSVAENLHLALNDEDLASYHALLTPILEAYDVLDAMPDNLPEVRYPRAAGRYPDKEEDPHHAWYVKATVEGAATGRLAGKTVALKDNICLAGVPMMNGASTLEGYVPDLDATVVTRILDAGGTILGKANAEYFCLSAGSHTNARGPTHNPRKRGYTTGGSSSGSAAIVAAGEADMALGGDQGGSIRIPASFCGIYGLKPTHGLVPYSGIMPIEVSLDHVGPMTRTVADNALLLSVIAGKDGLDPRQHSPEVADYTAALGQGVAGLRIGMVEEGFTQPGAEPDVNAAVRGAALALQASGAIVEDVSIPFHALAQAVWLAISLEGGTRAMMLGNTLGGIGRGLYLTGLGAAHSAWRARADDLSDPVKLSMIAGSYFTAQYGGRYFAKAQNLSRLLRDTYDQTLASYDLLVMPTTPMKASALPEAGGPRSLAMRRASESLANTSPFNCTGHPALSVPCGESEGLPVGLMLVGRHFAEATIYRAAAALERQSKPRAS